MCNSVHEVCPACRKRTGREYVFQIHGESDQCQMIDKGEIYVPRARLAKFECPQPRCTFNSAAIKANEAKLAAARKQPEPEDRKVPVDHKPSVQPVQVDLTTEDDVTTTRQSNNSVVTQPPMASPAPNTVTSGPSTPATVNNSWTSPTRSAGRKRQFFRAKHNVDRATLPTAIRQQIEDLMQKIQEKTPQQTTNTTNTTNQAPNTWLTEEDLLLQLLRINNFPYKQMGAEYLVNRTLGAIEHRRMKQRQGKVGPPFVYIPDREEEEESPARENKRARHT